MFEHLDHQIAFKRIVNIYVNKISPIRLTLKEPSEIAVDDTFNFFTFIF